MIRGTRVQHQRVGDIYRARARRPQLHAAGDPHDAGFAGYPPRHAAATNVDEAMRILAVEPIDVVISDYRLGDETGAEFMRLVRSMQDGKRFVPLSAARRIHRPRR
jgi:CheY-like chemotaxis protein